MVVTVISVIVAAELEAVSPRDSSGESLLFVQPERQRRRKMAALGEPKRDAGLTF